ncbi:MAG: PAS domain S-box protein [Candidatus Caldarchaeum sp.]
MLSQQLITYFSKPAALSKEDRTIVAEISSSYSEALHALEHGGPIRGYVLRPAPADVMDEVIEAKTLWMELYPLITLATEGDTFDQGTKEAYETLRTKLPYLRDASERVVASYVERTNLLRRRVLFILNVASSTSLALLIVGITLTRLYIQRPVKLIEDGTRRVREKQFDVRIPILTKDELAEVARSFNFMAAEIGRLLAAIDSERRYSETIIESLPLGLLALSEDLNAISANGHFLKMFRLKKEEISGKPVFDFLPFKELAQEVKMVMSTGQPKRDVIFNARSGEELRYYRTSISEMSDSERRARLLLAFEDITDVERIRREMEESEKSIQAIVEGLNAIIWEAESDPPRLTFVSKGAESLLGYPPEMWLSDPDFWYTHVHPDERDAVLSKCIRDSRSGIDHVLEYRMIARNGSIKWIRDIVHVMPNLNGSGYKLRGVMIDVTESKKQEETLRLQGAALEDIADTVIITDKNGIIEYVNSSFENLTGYLREEVIGRETPRILKSGAHDDTFYRNLWRTISSGTTFRALFTNRKKTGEVYYEEKTITPLKNAQGDITHYVSAGKDVTQQKKLEEELLHAQKMEAIGRLAGGVAHDFNNILTAALGHCDLLLKKVGRGSPLAKNVTEIKKAIERGKSLTSQLLTFSRKQVTHPKVLNITRLIIDMENMLKRLIGTHIELHTNLDQDLWNTLADESQVEQVILNLVVNSRDAMPQGGRITISTSNAVPPPSCIYATSLQEGCVKLTVEDTGSGIDPEVMPHIFEPFFTTKEVGKGTGLGLATVHAIVKQSGGHIEVHSEKNKGTRFTVYLPRTEENEERLQQEERKAVAFYGHETILVVEDEDAIREIICDFLREKGYNVLAASNGEEALGVCKQFTEPIHLMITDLVMPKIKGNELAELIAPLHPKIKIIYISGYAMDSDLNTRLKEHETEYIQKPFEMEELLSKIRRLLDSI